MAMTKVRITVLKATFDEELAAEYGAEGLAPCPMMKAGQVFLADYAKPEGFFCDEAWKAATSTCSRSPTAAATSRSTSTTGCACPDAPSSCTYLSRPVIMKLESTDIPAQLDYEPVR